MSHVFNTLFKFATAKEKSKRWHICVSAVCFKTKFPLKIVTGRWSEISEKPSFLIEY